MQPATLNGLMAATQTELPLPERARRLLSRDTILVRAIDGGSHAVLFPIPPDEVIGDPMPLPADATLEQREGFVRERQQAHAARERAWLRSTTEEERIAYRLAVERVKYHAIALAALEPRLTAAEAERLGSDADEIYLAILEFSGLLKKAASAPAVDAAVRE